MDEHGAAAHQTTALTHDAVAVVNRLADDAFRRAAVFLGRPHVGDERSVGHADVLDHPAEVHVELVWRVPNARLGQVSQQRLDPFVPVHVRRVDAGAHHHRVAGAEDEGAVVVEGRVHDSPPERCAAVAVVLEQGDGPSRLHRQHVQLHPQERRGVAHLPEREHGIGEVAVGGERRPAFVVLFKRMHLCTEALGCDEGFLLGGRQREEENGVLFQAAELEQAVSEGGEQVFVVGGYGYDDFHSL